MKKIFFPYGNPQIRFEQLRLDSGIKRAVRILYEGGVSTFESCEGGDGHVFSEPTIRFEGGKEEGYRAYAILTYNSIEVNNLRRCWPVIDGEITGPHWEIILR